jgi:hypothetical protein
MYSLPCNPLVKRKCPVCHASTDLSKFSAVLWFVVNSAVTVDLAESLGNAASLVFTEDYTR